MPEGNVSPQSWEGKDLSSLVCFVYLQACSSLENFAVGLRTKCPGKGTTGAFEIKWLQFFFLSSSSHTAWPSNQGFPAGSYRKNSWGQEEFWSNSGLCHFLSSEKWTSEVDTRKGTLHLGLSDKGYLGLWQGVQSEEYLKIFLWLSWWLVEGINGSSLQGQLLWNL